MVYLFAYLLLFLLLCFFLAVRSAAPNFKSRIGLLLSFKLYSSSWVMSLRWTEDSTPMKDGRLLSTLAVYGDLCADVAEGSLMGFNSFTSASVLIYSGC